MSLSIMIVDDDIDDIDIFIDAVHQVEASINCSSAQNGLEALKAINASHRKPDYVFVDLNMPKLNGKQFIGEIRKDAALNNIKVVIYTTSKLDNDLSETKLLGADEFMTKPTSLDELCQSIARIISMEYKGALN
jgi:CheY-like chemotaxis protein